MYYRGSGAQQGEDRRVNDFFSRNAEPFIPLPEDEELEPEAEPQFLYETLLGDQLGVPEYEGFVDRVFFNEAGVSDNLRHMCFSLPYTRTLNEAHPGGGFLNKMLLQRALNIPQDFIDRFTNSWGIITIKQFNKTTNRFYVMVIVHRILQYQHELSLIINMHNEDDYGDDVRVYEATNYQDYSDIPIGRFNVDWDNFNTVLNLPQRVNYRQINELSDFHRALQYMLLSFYFNQNCAAYDVLATDGRLIQDHPIWYNLPKAIFFTEHVRRASTINCYFATYRYMYDQFGRRQLVRSVITHNNI